MNKMTQSIFDNGLYSGWEQGSAEPMQTQLGQPKKYRVEDIAKLENALKQNPVLSEAN